MNPAILLLGLVIAAAAAAFVASLAYAGLYYAFDNSTWMFQALQDDLLASYKAARLDLAAGDWHRPAIAAAAGLFAGGTMLVTAMTGKKKSTDARFLGPLEARALGLTRTGGVFVGRIGGSLIKVPGGFTQRGSGRRRFLKPMLFGGKKLWIDGDDVGGFVIGPPRSGKGASLIVPNCLLWPDSIVVLDMRGETYEATAGFRSKFSRVLRFSPADENGDTECYNPLDFVAIDPDQRDIDINSIATALLPTPKGDAYWISDARALFAGVTSWVLENPDILDKDKNLGTVLNVVEGGDQSLREWLEEVANPELRAAWISSFTYTTLARFAVMASKQFDGVYGSLAAAVRPFKNNRILRATARSTFDIRAMRRENMSLYLDFRIQQIASIGPIFNVLMVQFMDYMSRNMMKRGERRVLVLLDEFQNLGKLENALTVATVLGGYGIPCWFFVQSLRSIDNVYTREGRQTLVNSARAQIFLGAQDPEDQRYVSQLLGERKEVTVDKAVSTGVTLFDRKGATMSHKTTMRPLMRPDELGAMNETRCIIKLRNQQPIFGVRNYYYADRELAKRAWLQTRAPSSKTPIDGPSNFEFETSEAGPSPVSASQSIPTPGAKFVANSSAVLRNPPSQLQPEQFHQLPDAASEPQRSGQNSDPPCASPAPDFRSALDASALRKAEADQSIEKILTILKTSPGKRRAANKVRKEVTSALADE
ncbi:type IV secretory system conjugative DNA transfer family protein [Shinella sp. CPCC 100929]|jgi:type IV secretion system protein VirD4|uniref:Type IV secretory system conjugative DNA transfer family protein n=1 Tax=Shinella lacus TaxID=2654216 RepID=A0ABT1RE71_9HYPH|nr:type IV secretory system conjugative DNA transfer family protein [Shinella lacus]MCQ4633447.1 type IV secretory system conjugative DNA transfer family protein [Shinella lacus]